MRRSLRGPLGAALNIGRSREEDPDVPPSRLPTSRAPRTPFNRSITAHRRCAFRSSSLDQVKRIKTALGATVNDVVMAACAGGLRRYLEAHDALPDTPLVAMVPVSIRTGEEVERWTNRVSGLVANLPTDAADPLARLQAVHDAMGDAKEAFGALPAEALTEFAQFSPPAVFTRAMRMSTRFRLGDRLNPTVNLVVSNVPGPRQALYAAGARLEHYYPVSIVIDGQGLNITVQSYEDKLDWGLISCRDLVPDLSTLLDYIIEDLDGMERLAEERTAT
jgi:WS/DGAT/MGAT family acyltransferase